MITADRQYRAFDFQSNEEEMRVEGQAVTFETPTVMYEYDGLKFYEVISRNAFNNASMSDVVLNIDHGGKPAAKTKNGTLVLERSDSGLFIKADLSKNATGRELHEDIKNGFYDKMSFAFTVRKHSYNKETRTRTIEEIDRLFDVSAVTFPAYEQTSISARSFFEAEVEEMRQHSEELLKREEMINAIKTTLKRGKE